MDDNAIRVLLKRLARAHPSGGTVVERAAVLAEGTGSDTVIEWMLAHGAQAEATAAVSGRHGLHGADRHPTGPNTSSAPARYILPPGAFD